MNLLGDEGVEESRNVGPPSVSAKDSRNVSYASFLEDPSDHRTSICKLKKYAGAHPQGHQLNTT